MKERENKYKSSSSSICNRESLLGETQTLKSARAIDGINGCVRLVAGENR